MKEKLGFIAMMLVIIAGSMLVADWMLPVPETDPRSLKHLLRHADQVNERAPFMVDDGLELFSVDATYGMIIYNYRLLDVTKEDFDNGTFSLSKSQVLQNVCTKPGIRNDLLGNGIIMSYVYHDKERRVLGSIDVLPKNCEAF